MLCYVNPNGKETVNSVQIHTNTEAINGFQISDCILQAKKTNIHHSQPGARLERGGARIVGGEVCLRAKGGADEPLYREGQTGLQDNDVCGDFFLHNFYDVSASGCPSDR